MENIQQETEIKLKTPKQDVLLAKLLQSSALTKRQRDYIVDKVSGRLITSYDASVLIAFLLAKIKFYKHFNDGKKHKIAECKYCKNKVNLKRYERIKTGKREWICSVCWTDTDKSWFIEVKKNKAVDPVVDEKQEVKADLHRKYDYPGGDVDEKIEINKAAQDYNQEIQDKTCARCEKRPAVQSNLCGACLDELDHN